MPNVTYLLSILKTANTTSVSVPSPRDAVIDNHGYLVTVEQNAYYLDRFDPTTLNTINHMSIASLFPINVEKDVVSYFNGAYYIVAHNDPMTVLDSENLSLITYITTTSYGIRDIIFLNNGQTLVGCSCETHYLIFLNQTSLAPISYSFSFSQSTSFGCPHGMWRVNDTYFYVTVYNSASLYSFTATGNYTHWTETFIFTTTTASGGAARVTVDDNGRFWFAFETDTILIYDQMGTQLGSWTIPTLQTFDIKIMDNYLMYLTSAKSSQIMRLDPDIHC